LQDASPTIRNSKITNSSQDGIYSESGTPALVCNNIQNNARYGINNTTPAITLTAKLQWWGSSAGPFSPNNTVSAGVDYTPWRTTPCEPPPPIAPTNLTATTTLQTQIYLAWQDNSSDESAFRIERSPNGTTGWTQIASVGANVTSYTNIGLNCSTTYYYRVYAYRQSDGQASDYSNVANATTAPCSPSNLSAPTVSETQINLAWQDNSPDESEFRVERSPNGTTGWSEIGTAGMNNPAYSDTGLSCSSALYYYRVRARRSSDNQYSNYSNITSAGTAPCHPTNLSATVASRTQINLSWQDNSPDETHFYIERSPNGSTGWSQIGTTGSNVATFSNTGLWCGTTYFYRVRAYRQSDARYSGFTNSASATTLPCLKVYLPTVLKN
jgi:titin